MQYPQDGQGKVSAGDWLCSVKLRKVGVQVSTKEMTETNSLVTGEVRKTKES